MPKLKNRFIGAVSVFAVALVLVLVLALVLALVFALVFVVRGSDSGGSEPRPRCALVI